jgi:hypothetical protein
MYMELILALAISDNSYYTKAKHHDASVVDKLSLIVACLMVILLSTTLLYLR